MQHLLALSSLKIDQEHFKYELEKVKHYGFDHIIVTGERPFGILFLDCYGRVFDWDDMSVNKKSETGRVAWGVEFDWTIVEIKDDSHERRNINLVAKDTNDKEK
ncbi:6098_t:CDS:2 [Diversispora eburnea]|uniref:6098_t:CDS:1 n=1 Tax=Diversispora eburnea TaxID=1213867 RepID=A0A9N9GID9_9GLOM|nr:6098_t:CDS:2 [Diversispora eburnea]